MRFFLLLLLTAGSLSAQAPFKVVGYLPTYRFSFVNQIEFERLTHLNIAFAHPDANGQLITDGINIAPVVVVAKSAGLQVFISLASSASWDAWWDYHLHPDRRAAFVANIVQYVQQHNLDGVDVDLEWDYVDDYYSPFVLALGTALSAEGKYMTAALPGSYRYPEVTDEALAAFDWINMMVYDLTGPWAPANPGQHSPFWWAEDCIAYWLNQDVSADRLTLGVPFYGYNFGVNPVSSFTYRSMVLEDTAFAYVDQVGARYYNGITTIKAKTQLALDEVGGIMMWELGQDATSASIIQYSLLRAIDTILPPLVSVQHPEIQALRIYPNPAEEAVWIPNTTWVRLWDINGRMVMEQPVTDGRIRVAGLAPGMYVVEAYAADRLLRGRLVKL